jgi:REP element-mobilizing transposase RayT
MAHTYTRLLVHIVFSTKHRVPEIDAHLKPRLFSYMGGILREIDATPVVINGTADHVHSLVGMPASLAVPDAARTLKANSSRWIHETWGRRSGFAW